MSLRPVLRVSFLLLVGTLCFSVEMPQANGQGILQRLRSRMQPSAPRPQYRPQYRPQTVTPGYSAPNTSRPAASATSRPTGPTSQGANAQAGRNTNPAQTQVFRIDPRTGRLVAVATSPTPNTSAPNPNTGGRPIQVAPPRTPGPLQSRSQPAKMPPTAAQVAGQQARPTLGLRVIQSASGATGLDVLKIQDFSLADKAGLMVGDRIVAMNGQAIADVESLSRAIQSIRVGQTGVLRVVRGNRVADLRVPVVAQPVATNFPAVASMKTAKPIEAARTDVATASPSSLRSDNGVRLGVDIEDRQGVRGVIITSVAPNSPAATAGIQTGDRLVAVDGRMVANSGALKRELSTRSKNKPMSVQLVRGSRVRASTISFSANPPNSSLTQSEPAPGTKPSQPQPATSGSMFGGVGSMVGSLFGNAKGGSANSPNNNDAKKKSTTKQSDLSAIPIERTNESLKQTSRTEDPLAVGKSILVQSEPAKAEPLVADPATAVSQSMPTNKGNSVSQASHVDDEMAFGDDEPLNKAVFSQPLQADAVPVETIPERKLEADRPIQKAPSTDPPSAAKIAPPSTTDKLKLNPPENPSSSTQERIKVLESEIRRLKKLLGDQ